MWELLGPAAAAFLLGIARGVTVCVMLCAPGMIPLIINEKASMGRSMFLGFLLSLPRMLLLTALGALLGYLSFEFFRQGFVGDALTAVSIASYIVLGIILMFVGAKLIVEHGDGGRGDGKKDGSGAPGRRGRSDKRPGRSGKGARGRKRSGDDDGSEGKACARKESWWERFILRVARKLYPARGKSQLLFLLWGGLLSLACVGEISGEAGLLAVMSTNTAAGTGDIDPATGAWIGSFIMFMFSLGATVPILVTAAIGGGLSKRVKDKEALSTIRGASAMLMVLLGLYFLFREIYLALDLSGVI